MEKILKYTLLIFALVTLEVTGPSARAQDFDPCNAFYEGHWARKEARKMWIDLNPKGNGKLSVIVGQCNGEEILEGTCVANPDGTVHVEIKGGTYQGELNISLGGYAIGQIGGSEFRGPAR